MKPVEHGPAEDVSRSIAQLLSTLSRIWEPAQVRFVMSAGGGRPMDAEWQVEATDTATALAVARQITTIAALTVVGVEFEEPRSVKRTCRNGSTFVVAHLMASRRARTPYTRWSSSAWKAAASDDVRWTLTVDIDALPTPMGETDWPEEELPTTYPESPAPATSPPFSRLVGCRIRLATDGHSASAAAITAMVSEDTRGEYGFQSLPGRVTTAPFSWLPLELAAHVLSAPARVVDAWGDVDIPPGRPSDDSTGARCPR